MQEIRNTNSDIVVLREVTKRFGNFVAVDKVSFAVPKGSFFSLLGPSGCGKTTTLRMIAGFETPTEGEVLIEGRVVNDVPPNHRPTNLVFQNLALFSHFTVYENLAFGLKMRRERKRDIQKKVNQILSLVNLPTEYLRKKVSQLSGGEQQRVAIGRALILEPKVLLLDEPLGPLDLKLREHMRIELRQIQERVGTTFIYVTHDQGEAFSMSDRIAIMNRGQVIQIGTPQELYEEPANEFVASFVGAVNVLEGVLESVQGKLGIVRVQSQLFRSRLRHPALPGQEGRLYVRPQRIAVLNNTPSTENKNRLRGTVTRFVFEGTLVHLEVSTPCGSITLTMPNAQIDSSLMQVGNEVTLVWSPLDTLFMTTEKGVSDES